jgi:hypothetical protein
MLLNVISKHHYFLAAGIICLQLKFTSIIATLQKAAVRLRKMSPSEALLLDVTGHISNRFMPLEYRAICLQFICFPYEEFPDISNTLRL